MNFQVWRTSALLLVPIALSGCERPHEMAAGAPAIPAAAASVRGAIGGTGPDRLEPREASEPAAPPSPSPLRRYLAVRHELRIFTAADGVEAAWHAALDACAAAGCEVLASSLNHDDERQPASASLEARVPPAGLDAFLGAVSALGTVGQHNTTAEDKTDDVIDTEARQKNSVEFRDSLRGLMGTPNAKFKDLIDVERELARVQSDIDSLAARRMALANETDKVQVRLFFNARQSVLESGMWSPVKRAVLSAGHVLARSIATLIDVAVALAPWLLALLAAAVAGRSLWRRRRRRKAG